MKMKKRMLSAVVLIVALTVMSLSGCGGNKESDAGASESTGKRVWKFAHTRAEGTDNDVMANEFADNLTGAIDNLQIDIYPNNQLGDYTVVQEAVGMDEVQLMLGSMSPTVDSTLSVQIAPYLATNWDDAEKLYNSEDGAMYQYVSDRLVDQNIKLLAVIPKYFGDIMTTKELKNIEDPKAPKGAKIRVPQQNAFEKFATAVGFTATPLPTSDTFTALQTNVVDGASGGGAEQYWNDYGELVKYVYRMKTHFECHWLYMSMETWNGLSEEEQDTITKYAKQLEDEAFKMAIENEDKYAQMFKDKGVTVYEPDEKVLEAYEEYVRTNVWPEIASEYGDIWDELTSQINK